MKLVANIFAVVVILGLLAAIIVPTVPDCGPSNETAITKVEMGQIGTAFHFYHHEYGRLPDETDNARLMQILEGDNPRKLKFYILNRERCKTGQLLDGWEKPLLFKPNANGLLIRSAGKDGIYYSQDDITEETHIRTPTTASAQK